MVIKLIVTDMDGTFLNEEKSYDKALAKEIFSRLEMEGIAMMIASGNMVKKLETYFDLEDLEFLYLAGDDGIVLDHDGELKALTQFKRTEFLEILEYVEAHPHFIPVISTGDEAYILKSTPSWAREAFSVYYDEPIEVDNFREIPEECWLIKFEMLTQESLAYQKEFMKTVEERFEFANSVTSGENWLDIYPAGGGKGGAVRFMQEQLGITASETITFGDSLNDRSMMQEARYSCAMENADAELIEKDSQFKVGTNEEQAVLNVIEEYLNTKNIEVFEKYRLVK